MIIEIAYSNNNNEYLEKYEVNDNSTIAAALKTVEFHKLFPEVDFTTYGIGVFAKQKSLDYILKPGDRIEIYPPLLIHPMDARRIRAKNCK